MTSEMTVGDLLARAATSERGVSVAGARAKESKIRYGELYARALRRAAALRWLGLHREDRVAIALPLGTTFFEALFGVVLAGGAAVPLPPAVLTDRSLARLLLGICRPRLVLTPARARRLMARAARWVAPGLGVQAAEKLVATAEPPPFTAPEDTVFVSLTAGCSAAPKAVRLTHRQALAAARSLAAYIMAARASTPEPIVVSGAAPWESMGLFCALLPALDAAAEAVMVDPAALAASPLSWLRILTRRSATVAIAPTRVFERCGRHADEAALADLDLGACKLALFGGEVADAAALDELATRCSRLGLAPTALTPVYGLAEAGYAVCAGIPPRPLVARRVDAVALAESGCAVPTEKGLALMSVGKSLPGCEIRIVSEEGVVLAEDALGRIQVRGAAVMAGYQGNAWATQAALASGWLETGDLGFTHAGELYVYGRTSDLLRLGDRRHAPATFEHAARRVEGVEACAAVMIRLTGSTAGVLLLVETAASGTAAGGDLASAVRRSVAAESGVAPSRVVLLPLGTLPRGPAGKLRRTEALLSHRRGLARPGRPFPSLFARAAAATPRARAWRPATHDDPG